MLNIKNSITLIGRMTKDVTTSQTPSGTLYSNFSIAVDRPYRKDKETGTDFINCTAWGKTAEFISAYFHKGEPIMLQGELRQHNYTNKDGAKVFTYVVNVNNVNFPLTAKSKSDTVQSNNNAPIPPMPEEFDMSGFEDIEDGAMPY